MSIDSIYYLLNDTALSDEDKYKIICQQLVEFSREQRQVLDCLRVLKLIKLELMGLLQGPVLIGERILQKLIGAVDIEIEVVIYKIEHPELAENTELPPFKLLHWTASTPGMVEIIYLIQGCVNNGTVEAIEIVRWFGYIFQIDLSNVYKIIGQIAKRKKDRTKFLDQMKLKFINLLDTIATRKPMS